MNIFILAWRNIINHPLNLLMSIILFGLGVGLISFLLQFNDQLNDKFSKNLAEVDLVVGAKGSPLQMILCNMYHIDNPTGNVSIKTASPLLRDLHPLIKTAIPLSLGDNYKSYRIVGTNHDFLKLYGAVIKEGSLWSNNFDVTVGSNVATELKLKIGDQFVSSHGFNEDDHVHDNASFTVKGILGGTGTVVDQLILTNTASIWLVHEHESEATDTTVHHDQNLHKQDSLQVDEKNDEAQNTNEGLLKHPEQEITSVLIQYKSRTNFQALNFGRNINENTDMQAASPAIEMNRLYNMIGVGTDALKGLALLIALVSAFSIFISLLKSMRSRKYELALLRVMGAPRSTLFSLITIEGVFLGIIGFIVGTFLSHAFMELLAVYLKADFRYSFTGWKFLKAEWWILLVSILLGFVAALIPAIQAARTDINKILSEK